MSVINFDASGVPPSTGELEPIPAAWYDVAMDQSETKPTKDAATTGHSFLECRFNVTSGQYAGRKLYARFNLNNSNPVAKEIAYKEFSAVCHATGVMQVMDSQQLHGIPLKVKVKVRAAEGNYGPANDITTYKPANFVPDAPAGAVAAGGQPPMQPQGFPPQQAWQQPPSQQGWQQPAQAPQPTQQPQQPQQPWQAPQQPAQQPMQPQQPPAQQQPAWQAPQQPQQPWQQQPPAQQMQPAQPPMQQPAQAPQQPWQQPGNPANPQSAVPPWQRPAGT